MFRRYFQRQAVHTQVNTTKTKNMQETTNRSKQYNRIKAGKDKISFSLEVSSSILSSLKYLSLSIRNVKAELKTTIPVWKGRTIIKWIYQHIFYYYIINHTPSTPRYRLHVFYVDAFLMPSEILLLPSSSLSIYDNRNSMQHVSIMYSV